MSLSSPCGGSAGSNSEGRRIFKTSAAWRLPRVTHSFLRLPTSTSTQRTVSSACQAAGDELVLIEGGDHVFSSGLSALGRAVLSFLREKVRKDGLTIFVSSHLMSEIEEFCDTVFVINRGHLVASGRVKELLKPHERIVRVTFQGKVPDRDFISRHEQIRNAEALTADTMQITLAQDDSAWLNQCLQQAGFRVSAIAPKQKTLKEFFLSITGLRRAEVPPSIHQPPSGQAGLRAPQGQAPATQAGDKYHV
jgi:hypothetical protein